MAIAFVSGATTGTTSAVTTLSVTYAPTAGNIVIVTVGTSGTSAMTCADSSNNPLTPGPSKTNTVICNTFYYTAASGITGFTASWTTGSPVNIAVAEYSGVSSVNANLAGNTASGTSTTATITVTTQDSNDWIVGGEVSNTQVITQTVGTARETIGTAAPKLKIADNTVAAAGAVSLTGTLTSAAWAIAVIELRTVAAPAGGSNWLSKAVATGVNKH